MDLATTSAPIVELILGTDVLRCDGSIPLPVPAEHWRVAVATGGDAREEVAPGLDLSLTASTSPAPKLQLFPLLVGDDGGPHRLRQDAMMGAHPADLGVFKQVSHGGGVEVDARDRLDAPPLEVGRDAAVRFAVVAALRDLADDGGF